MNTQTIELDVSKGGFGRCVKVGQGDHEGTTIRALLYDNGAELDLTGATVYLVARLPDRQHYYRAQCTPSGNVATCALDESKLCAVPGYTDEAYLTVTKGGATASTERFALDIVRSALDGVEPAESHDTAVDDAIKRSEAATSAATSAAGTASSAATKADTATAAADRAASAANSAASSANSAKAGADSAASAASKAADSANSAATSASAATDSANSAAKDALSAAEEARGSVSADRKIYLTFDSVGGTDYISLVDTEE